MNIRSAEIGGTPSGAETIDPILHKTTGRVVAALQSRKRGESYWKFAPRYRKVKEECQHQHPDRLQEIELLFDLEEFLHFGLEFKRGGKITRFREKIKALTEFQFTATDYIAQNAENREYLQALRRSFERIATAKMGTESAAKEKIDASWRGLLGQVATFHILGKLDLHPTLAHPEEDAFEKTDLHCELPTQKASVAIQAKHRQQLTRTTLTATKTIRYPAVKMKHEQTEVFASSTDVEGTPHLTQSVSSKTRPGVKVIAISVHIHPEGCDPITGVPTEETVEGCRKQLERVLTEPKASKKRRKKRGSKRRKGSR